LILENDPSNTSFYTAFYNLCAGLVDLKWGKIDSANSKLDKMKAVLLKVRPPYKNSITFSYDLFYGELLLKAGNLDKAIAVCEEASISGLTQPKIPRLVEGR